MATKKAPKVASKGNESEIDILRVNQGRVTFCILGTTPIILNRMSEKVLHQLLMPNKKTTAERQLSLKHDPLAEYRASAYTDRNPNGPTVLQFLSSAFKQAMASVALDIPGATRSQLERLTWVTGERVALYGVQQMLMSVTRSADMNRTPDVRTRAIVPNWACQITVAFASPMLNEKTIANLMASAGFLRGVGDWRQEKGSANYGSFELVEKNDPRWTSIVKTGGRAAQEAAMKDPAFFDQETEEMYEWFQSEVENRGKSAMLAPKNGASSGASFEALD